MTVSALREDVAHSDVAHLDPAHALMVEEAERRADEAAAAATVTIRAVESVADCARASELLGAVWHLPSGRSPAEPNMLRVLGYRGGYVAGAYTDNGELAGVAVGFFTGGIQRELHSHLTGVSAGSQGRGLGAALKLHQRAWALRQGIGTITWTFDPLIRRNAAFNLIRLGATATDYLTNFYGAMSDGINAGVESDRLFIRWATAISRRPTELPRGIQVLHVGDGETPRLTENATADVVQLDLPVDIERLRRSDPSLAAAWRVALREAMAPRLASGWTVNGFTPTGGYVMSV